MKKSEMGKIVVILYLVSNKADKVIYLMQPDKTLPALEETLFVCLSVCPVCPNMYVLVVPYASL